MRNLWRLNVRRTQIEECIRESLFAVDRLPRSPRLEAGDVLLLQLVRQDAEETGEGDRRIQFALVFERAETDEDGSISRLHWPRAGKTWRYILHCSDTVPTIPFSLEAFPFGQQYLGQANPQFIAPEDARLVWPLIKVAQEEPKLVEFPADGLLATIRNYDRVVAARVPVSREEVVRRYGRDPWLPAALKALYAYRCQICQHDFKPRYGVPYSEILHLNPLSEGGLPVSRNLVVLCPNHHRIARVAEAAFRDEPFRFEYPNGLREYFELTTHFAA